MVVVALLFHTEPVPKVVVPVVMETPPVVVSEPNRVPPFHTRLPPTEAPFTLVKSIVPFDQFSVPALLNGAALLKILVPAELKLRTADEATAKVPLLVLVLLLESPNVRLLPTLTAPLLLNTVLMALAPFNAGTLKVAVPVLLKVLSVPPWLVIPP